MSFLFLSYICMYILDYRKTFSIYMNSDVVRLERPDLETMRNDLITKINADKGQLQAIENRILSLLYSAGDDILNNEELIETLNDSKETSTIIVTRLSETEATEKKISIAREKYRSLAICGSLLYFIVASLSDINPMYQFSLKYFNHVSCKSLFV